MTLESIAISILEGEDVDVNQLHTSKDVLDLIDHLHAWLPNYPAGSNKFIKFLHDHLLPIQAVYGLYSAVDNGSLEIGPRNLQTMMMFEKDLGYLIKHLENPDKKTNFYASMRDGTEMSYVELALTSPFTIQPEEEIGTGTYEQKVAIEDLFADTEEDDKTTSTAAPGVTTTTKSPTNKISVPTKRKLREAVDKVLGEHKFKGDMTEDERDSYYVFSQFLFRKLIISPNLNVSQYVVVSSKYYDEFNEIDELPIEQYLADIIPNWGTEWKEISAGTIEYSGIENGDDILKSTGYFKEYASKEAVINDIMSSASTVKIAREALYDAISRLPEEDVKAVFKGMKDDE